MGYVFVKMADKNPDIQEPEADLETDMMQFFSDLSEFSLVLKPDSPEARQLNALCEQFSDILHKTGIKPPSKPSDDVPF